MSNSENPSHSFTEGFNHHDESTQVKDFHCSPADIMRHEKNCPIHCFACGSYIAETLSCSRY